MAKILLTTIHRSFTHSVFAMLQEEHRDDTVTRIHVWPKGILAAKTGEYRIITTFRHPYNVAESWANRSSAWRSGLWREQWKAWAEIVPMAEKIYKVDDLDRKLGAFGYGVGRKAKIPEVDIKYARDICIEVMEWL